MDTSSVAETEPGQAIPEQRQITDSQDTGCWYNALYRLLLNDNDERQSPKVGVGYGMIWYGVAAKITEIRVSAAAAAAGRVRSATRWGITISPSSRQTTRTQRPHPHHCPVDRSQSSRLCETRSAPPLKPPPQQPDKTTTSAAPAIAPAQRWQPHRPWCKTVRPRRTGRPATTITITRTITSPRRPRCSSRSTAPRSAARRHRSKNPTASGYPPSRACFSSPTYVSWPLSSFLGVTSSACYHWGNIYIYYYCYLLYTSSPWL